MKSSSRAEGFTIVETLIVLAVTGLLFVSAALAISGRQASAQFTQGVRKVESQLQATINEVSSGYYPNNGDITCDGITGEPRLRSGVADRGTNEGCMFLGKVLQLAVDDGSEPESYNVYSLVGLRANSSGIVASLADARPKVIAASSADSATPDVFDEEVMPYGLTVERMHYGNLTYDTSRSIGAVGFVSRLDDPATSSPSQQLELLAIPGTATGDSKIAGVDGINDNIDSLTVDQINPEEGVHICLKSGTTNQSALVTLGGGGRPLSITVLIKGTADCT